MVGEAGPICGHLKTSVLCADAKLCATNARNARAPQPMRLAVGLIGAQIPLTGPLLRAELEAQAIDIQHAAGQGQPRIVVRVLS